MADFSHDGLLKEEEVLWSILLFFVGGVGFIGRVGFVGKVGKVG